MHSNKKQKKNKGFSLLVLIALVLYIVISFLSSPSLKQDVSIEILQGTSSIEISEILKDNGIIKSRLLFLVRTMMPDTKGNLKYGKFEFTTEDNLDGVIKKLTKGGKTRETVTVTIPEGYSVKKNN